MDGKYSEYVNDAGMLGYVLAGDVPDIVKIVNDKMLLSRKSRKSNSSTILSPTNNKSSSSHKLTDSDHLSAYNPIKEFNDIYFSQHYRKFRNNSIQLYHLFLTFDF